MRITTLLAATLCVLPHQVLARSLVEPDEAARAADADAHVEAGKNAAVSTLGEVVVTARKKAGSSSLLIHNRNQPHRSFISARSKKLVPPDTL